MKHVTKQETRAAASIGFLNPFGKTVALRADGDGNLDEIDVLKWIDSDIEVADLHAFSAPEVEIEQGLIAAFSDLDWARDKMRVLYVCSEGLNGLGIADRCYPVYDLRRGRLELKDTARLKGRPKFDLIIISASARAGESWLEFIDLARTSLKPSDRPSRPKEPRRASVRPTACDARWLCRAVA